MILKLQQAGQPILRRHSKRLTKQRLLSQHTQDVIDFMIATLRDAPGVGLAAPQVGESLQIIIIEDRAKYHDLVPKELLREQLRKVVPLTIIVNPVLEVLDTSAITYFEGCLSVDGYVAAVDRAYRVRVSGWDRNGKELAYEAVGWQARILQHEMDHLAGKLYTDSMRVTSFMSMKNFSLLWRKALTAKIASTFKS